jgi:hypothetical protein
MRTTGGGLFDAVVRKLRSIEGVVDLCRVEDSEKQKILELEKAANQTAGGAVGIEIVNKGAACALEREYVVCVNHSPALRHPSKPILILAAGEDVVGEEIWEKDRIERLRTDSNALFLGKSFVIFKDKVNRTGERRLRFEYGPQDFPEIRMIQGVCDVVSGTISPAADIYVKRMAKWDTANPDMGTVLIGFNSSA